MNKNDAINGALRWIDEATVNGAAASNGFIADYKDRMEHLLDGAVAMVESQFPLIESISIVQNMPRCMDGSHFEPKTVYPGDTYEFTNSDAKAYTLEICGVLTANIDGARRQITAPEFQRISGSFNGSIKLESQYPFQVRNAAFYAFPLVEIPEHIAWVPYELPQQMNGMVKILFSGDGVTFRDFSDYRRLDEYHIAIPYHYSGQFDIQYKHRHTTLAGASGATEIEVEPRAVPLVPLRLAIDATSGIDETLALNQFLTGRFAEMVGAMTDEDTEKHQVIETVFMM
mgnify:FL=1|nr:MAG TPA: hypothetical protein [Caudoviricetes sp.]